MAIIPLTVDPPPRPRPRTCARGSWARVRRDWSPGHWNAAHAASSSARQPLRLRSCGGASLARQSGPASSSRTSCAGSSLSRAASTQPALPPPTTSQSVSMRDVDGMPIASGRRIGVPLELALLARPDAPHVAVPQEREVRARDPPAPVLAAVALVVHAHHAQDLLVGGTGQHEVEEVPLAARLV